MKTIYYVVILQKSLLEISCRILNNKSKLVDRLLNVIYSENRLTKIIPVIKSPSIVKM